MFNSFREAEKLGIAIDREYDIFEAYPHPPIVFWVRDWVQVKA